MLPSHHRQDTVPEPAAWQARQRQMFMLLVLLATLASGAALWSQRPTIDRLDGWALPTLVALLVALQGLLSLRRIGLSTAFRIAYVGGASYVLLALNHQFSVMPVTSTTLMENTYWFAVLYTATFLAFPSRQAALVSGSILALSSAICLWHLRFTVPHETQGHLIGASLQFLLTGGVLIVLNATLGDQHRRLMAARMAAYTDVLTGLANRRAAEEHLGTLAQGSEPFTLVLFDLDHFKQVNDRYGHATGDLVLRQVATTVRAHLPPGGMAARWGGEEFLLILPPLNPAQARDMLGTLRRTLARQSHGPVQGITACFGVATASPGEHPDRVLARADAVMYHAKEQGRDDVRIADLPDAGQHTSVSAF